MKYKYIIDKYGLINSNISLYLLKKLVDKVLLLDHFGGYVELLTSTFFDYRKFRFAYIEDNIILNCSKV